MLFPESSEHNAGHSLRQQLYKAKSLGFPVRTDADSASIAAELIDDDYSALLDERALDDSAVSQLAAGFLPGYSPAFSEPFLEWLDQLRQRVSSRLLTKLMKRVTELRSYGRWGDMGSAARACLALDPLHEEGTLALAESLAMSGSRSEAMLLLDRYAADVGASGKLLRQRATLMLRRIGEQMPPGTSSPTREPRFVGRDQEYSRLRRLYASARAGQSQAVVLHGEGGIGKTRIARELLTQGQLDGASTIRVACQPQDRHRPLSVFGELVERLQKLPGALGCAPSSLRVLRSLINAPSLPPEHTPTRAETERSSADISAAIHDLFDAVASEQALLLLVDDAHWLDDPSKELICSLVSTASSQRTLIVLTSRQSNLLVGEDAGVARVTHLRVAPLSQESAEVVLGDLATDLQDSIDTELAQWLLQTAAGSPFLLQALIAHYRVHRSRFSVPEKLTELLGRRLDQLTTAAARVFDACIMLGRHATIAHLRAVSELPNVELLECVRRLEEEGYLVSDGAQLRSSHDLLSEVAVTRLPPGATKLLHLQCARALEEGIADQADARLLWDCAEHWNESGEAARAVELLQSCARHALQTGYPQYAATLFGRAADLTNGVAEKAAILQFLVQAASLADDWLSMLTSIRSLRMIKGSAHSEQAHDELELLEITALGAMGSDHRGFTVRLNECVAAETATPEHRLAAARRLMGIATHAFDADLARDVWIASNNLHPSSPTGILYRLRLELAYHADFGDLGRVSEIGTSLLAAQFPSDISYSFDKACLEVAFWLHLAGCIDESRALLVRTVQRTLRNGSAGITHICAGALADQAMNIGDIACAKEWLAVANEAERKLGQRIFIGGAASSAIRIALLEGNPNQAGAILAQAENDFTALKQERERIVALGYHVRIRQLRGEMPLDAHVAEMTAAFPKLKNAPDVDDIVAATWHGLDAKGRTTEADELLREYITRSRRARYPLIPEIRELAASRLMGERFRLAINPIGPIPSPSEVLLPTHRSTG